MAMAIAINYDLKQGDWGNDGDNGEERRVVSLCFKA